MLPAAQDSAGLLTRIAFWEFVLNYLCGLQTKVMSAVTGMGACQVLLTLQGFPLRNESFFPGRPSQAHGPTQPNPYPGFCGKWRGVGVRSGQLQTCQDPNCLSVQ